MTAAKRLARAYLAARRTKRLREARWRFELQLDAFNSGMNTDVNMLRSRYVDLVDAAVRANQPTRT